MLSESQKKITVDFLDLMGINVVNDAGDVVLTIDQNGIRWDSKSNPVKVQFSVTGAVNTWHDIMTANDKYRRESFDGGKTWGDTFQFMGVDGRPGSDGSDANVPQWVKEMVSTYINDQWVISPNIVGGNITALDRMEAICDFHVGKNIYLGQPDEVGKSISLGNGCKIANVNHDMQLGALTNMYLLSNGDLDLSGVRGNIIWGKNAPIATFA